jgi:hypothetical protein
MRRFNAVPRSQRGESRASGRKTDGRLRYGGSWPLAASALPLEGGLTRPRPLVRLVAAALRRPRHLAALVAVLLRTQREYVALSESCTGQALDRYFNQRSLGILPQNRLCRAVLLLPQNHADYLRGRHRQALRTNLRRAAAAGIRCEVVSDPRRAGDAAAHVLRGQGGFATEAELHAHANLARAAFARPETTVAVARDEHGRPLAIAAAVIDDVVCLINGALATSHEARWALHDHLVQILIARRVRCLLAEGGGPFGALGFTANLQHYQHLLGYELRHMRPAAAPRATRRRRVLASLLLAAASATLIAPPAAASTPRMTATPRLLLPDHSNSRTATLPPPQ